MNKTYFLKYRNAKFLFLLTLIFVLFFSYPLFAQSGLEGRINVAILNLVRVINILIVGFVAWSGFLIAKGDGAGVSRLIYGIVGLVVVNSAYMIINFFN